MRNAFLIWLRPIKADRPIYVPVNTTIIGSDNGLQTVRHQAFTWPESMWIRVIGTMKNQSNINQNDIWKKCTSAKWLLLSAINHIPYNKDRLQYENTEINPVTTHSIAINSDYGHMYHEHKTYIEAVFHMHDYFRNNKYKLTVVKTWYAAVPHVYNWKI